jgi:hypothetical protein
MTIKTIRGVLALAPAPALATSEGLDFDFNFSVDNPDDDSWDLNFSGSPGGSSFDFNFTLGVYLRTLDPVDYPGSYYVASDGADSPNQWATMLVGTAPAAFYDGWDFNFALHDFEFEPFGYEGVDFDFNFVRGRYIVNAFPPPLSWDLDFETDTYQVLGSGYGLSYGLSYGNADSPSVFTRTLVPVKTAYTLEQIVIDRPLDDRIGGFVLGRSLLGGPPV